MRSTDEPMLDPDAEKVVYEVNDWTTEQLVTLTDGLMERGIGYEFDVEGDLVVLATDEDGVEALLDVIEFGPAEADAAGRRRTTTTADEARLDEAAIPTTGWRPPRSCPTCSWPATGCRRTPATPTACWGWSARPSKLAGRPLPFGYEPAVWEGMVGAAGGLRDDLEGDEATDDELEGKARAPARSACANYVVDPILRTGGIGG